MPQPYELSIIERARLLAQEIHDEFSDPTDTSDPYTRMVEIILPCWRYNVRREMSMKAARLPHARFDYDDTSCIYSNKEHQIILEFPHARAHAIYIAGIASGKTVIAAFDFTEHPWVLRVAKEIIGEGTPIEYVRGGELNYLDGTIMAYGTCKEFGTADHEQTAHILRKAGLEARVAEQHSNNLQDHATQLTVAKQSH